MGLEQVMAEPVVTDRSVVAFDVGILLRVARLDVIKPDASAFCPGDERADEIAKGLRIVKSAFSLPATLSIPLKLLESDELTEKWPLVLERLRVPARFGKVA